LETERKAATALLLWAISLKESTVQR